MPEHIIFRTGEATVEAKAGQFTDAMPEILIGEVSGASVRRNDGPERGAYARVRHSRLQSNGEAGDDDGAKGNDQRWRDD